MGSFDGTTFVPEDDYQVLDHGRDNYAGVSFSGLPDQERTLIAWMSNWIYARELPVLDDEPRRGAMTLARRLSLAAVDDKVVLRQVPVGPELTVEGQVRDVRAAGPRRLPLSVPACCRIDLEVNLGEAVGASIRLRHGDDGEGGVVLGYDGSTGEVRFDRSSVGAGFPASFRAIQVMPTTGGDRVALDIWTDVNSVEMFADDGLSTLTSLVEVPTGDGITVEGIGGEVSVSVTVSVPAQD